VRVLFGMVVRERRRIASLARTASSLDERVQEAEATSISKDEAFRAYVNDQRLEAASDAQNQQDHILSLMEMVKEEPTAESNGKSNSNTPGNSKLLVLANERIAVLERQHHELQLECERLGSYRESEENTASQLEEKTTECDDLEEEIDSLRSILRRIRDDISQHAKYEGNSEVITPESTSNLEVSQRTSLLDVIKSALDPREASPSAKSRKPSKRSNKSNIIELDRSFDLEYNSDDSDDVPDWAEDIMIDLATIAEGKMPSSLLESTDVMDAEARLEENNVFDRLTNPSGFTGVQKQREHLANRHLKPTQKDPDTPGPGEERKVMSVQVSESLSKLVIPEESESPRSKRSVFDRLLSPSNATGTQKNRMQDNQRGRRSHSASIYERNRDDASIDNQSRVSEDTTDDTRSKHSEFAETLSKTTTQAHAIRQQFNVAEKILDDILPKDYSTTTVETLPTNTRHERIQEYTQQNVFERLQKTTTRASAIKRDVVMAEKLLDNVLDAQDESRGPPSELSNGSTAGSSVGSTGDRVDSKKAGVNLSNPAPPKRRSRKAPTQYSSVFERLHQTTTEAKAKKSNHRSSRSVTSM
jgi:hypothetical protein